MLSQFCLHLFDDKHCDMYTTVQLCVTISSLFFNDVSKVESADSKENQIKIVIKVFLIQIPWDVKIEF